MTVSSTRRNFLKTGTGVTSAIALNSVLPRPLLARFGNRPEPAPPIQDARVKGLVQKALDAARSAGASYADVRITFGVSSGGGKSHGVSGSLHTGVRALVQGYWGFASGPLWDADEIVRLARIAVRQAKACAGGKAREVDLGTIPVVKDGHWVMPVAIDPLTVHSDEVTDYLAGLAMQISHEAKQGSDENISTDTQVSFVVQERAFGSTSGSFCTQRLYRSEGSTDMLYEKIVNGVRRTSRDKVDLLTPASVGWELFLSQPIRETAIQLVDDMRRNIMLPFKPVDVGRYTVVIDAQSVAQIVSDTIGAATELDRALGYEANAGGTSYLTDPFAMLDTFKVGPQMLTVTANRSETGGAATVKWDEEGVVPTEFPLLEQGVLRNVQTTREGAGWLNAALPASSTRPRAQSNGCANSPSANEAALAHTANLVMQPGPESASSDNLVQSVEKGIALRDMQLDMDFQQLNGYAFGTAHEIKDGKIVATLMNMGVLFRTPELWKSLIQLGGPKSVRRYGLKATKGEPVQTSYHSVTAVPAVFKDLTVIDISRR